MHAVLHCSVSPVVGSKPHHNVAGEVQLHFFIDMWNAAIFAFCEGPCLVVVQIEAPFVGLVRDTPLGTSVIFS